MHVVHLGTGEKKRSNPRQRIVRRLTQLLGTSEPVFDRPVTGRAARNAGDKLLSEAFQYYITEELGASQAPFMNCRKRFTRRHVDAINGTAGVVVGGGGLFLYDTFPNLVSDWQWGIDADLLARIQVPILVMAVGYNQFRHQRPFTRAFDRSVTALVDKSAFFSLRHRGTSRS
jgi:hypothetical protein